MQTTTAKNKRVTVTRSFEFDVAHKLESHDGKCKGIHGHRYKLEVTIQAPIDKSNMILDSYKFKEIVEDQIISKLDHGGHFGQTLNDIMLTPDPTVEFMVLWIYHLLMDHLPIKKIRLYETPNFCAELEIDEC